MNRRPDTFDVIAISVALYMVALFLAVALFPPDAKGEPLRLEAQAGTCRVTRAAEGVWHSSYYPTNFDLTSRCGSLGVSRVEGNYRGTDYGWRLQYVHLGTVHGDNIFTNIEPQYPGETGENAEQTGRYRARGQMSQKTQGVSLGGLLERPAGPVTLGVGAGLLAYYSRFDVYATDSLTGKGIGEAHWGDWLLSPYLEATARYGYLFASFTYYTVIEAHERNCVSCTGMTDNGARKFTVGVQVPF